ncbi:ATP-binding protein [Mycolicibacterium rhodesiae]|uniref:Cyclase n=1 Tax=Mycolicibacterium rhodesiae TaxID=36814 RepID=A0A1X0IPQ5_MYCRH|nr:adenylate/guanylate cyclase domain-containing protein [Mycolicibacterium rhodesiae]MCV7347412.1 AAA family ATPase [Mycolicibacterium rhodesiae]ORB49707.1 cyclase [Mycolicibacterium rhodesiae]
MTADTACGSCGRVLRGKARFCDQCGAPTAGPGDAAEYKQVTVLFADVARSMDLAAALDLERLREVMTDLVERSAAVARRYGGSVEYNGDGIMALFGAPTALEDHAFRACLAGLDIQDEMSRLAAAVKQRDGIEIDVRVGLNSGRVIAGEIGSGALGYRATGETVGLAQRMESTAPVGAVMVSESTARLVENAATLADPEWVRIKGADRPVRAYRLVNVLLGDRPVDRAEATLVGRRWEMAVLDAIAERAIDGRGGVVRLVGPPGIGKSRVARETAAMAADRGIEVVWTLCGSHTAEMPFYAVSRLLRAVTGVVGLDPDAARQRLRSLIPGADPQDLLLLNDLLGVADSDVPLPRIDPDARRRRLTALVNTVSLARVAPALLIVEDVHWMDAVSESMLTDFLAVVPRTPAMVLITFRPEYVGSLAGMASAQTVSLGPLGDSDTATLLTELLGADASVQDLVGVIGDRAAGNPFFAEEMVRELAQRGVLTGSHGHFTCRADVTELSVPVTVQAAISARIDRLGDAAKRTLHAAAVIGAHFGAELLATLDVETTMDELLRVELVDQIRFTPTAEYAFRHPLIQAVAYESQLKSDRARWHRRLAGAIEQLAPDLADENAVLVAEHLYAAGDLQAAYAWHMRAGAWSASRDIYAARLNWEKARVIADELPDDATGRLSMRIAPRTMLCASDFHASAITESSGRFAELRELCAAAGDSVSLAIGMTGQVTEYLYVNRAPDAAVLASEQMDLLDSIGDPNLTVGLSFPAFATWFNQADFAKISRWTQRVIDLAADDPTVGAGFGFASPLSAALAFRGISRWWQGQKGWRDDLRDATTMAQTTDPATLGFVLAWTYGVEIGYGVLRADDCAIEASQRAVESAKRIGNDNAVTIAEYGLGVALLYRESESERHRGLELMDEALAMLRVRVPSLVPVTEMFAARERARIGDRDAAISVIRDALTSLYEQSSFGWIIAGVAILVEALAERRADGDLVEAQDMLDGLDAMRSEHDSAILDITTLRLRTLLAKARDEDSRYRELLRDYRATAESLGFEGHIAWAIA